MRNKQENEQVAFTEDFGDELAVVDYGATTRGTFHRPLTDERRAVLFQLMGSMIESGIPLADAYTLIKHEADGQFAAAATIFFGELETVRAAPAGERATMLDKAINKAFGRQQVETEERIALHAMAHGVNLVPLLRAAATLAQLGPLGRKGLEPRTTLIAELRKQA